MRTRRLIAAVTLALAASLAFTDRAAARVPRWSLGQRLWLGARVEPLGLCLESETTVRWRFGPDGSFLLEDDHVDLGAFASVTPALSLVGATLELQPAAFLVLRARALRVDWFGTFGAVSTFASLDDDWSPDALTARDDADAGRASHGLWLDVDAQLRALVGDFVALAELHPIWLSAAVEGPYYEPYEDLLLAPDDRILDAQALVGWIFLEPAEAPAAGGASAATSSDPTGDTLFAGLRWQLLVGDAAAQPRHTLAALVHWERALAASPRAPTLSVDGLVGLYLADRYRAGDPWLAVAGQLQWRL